MEKGNIINIIIFVAALVLVSLIGIKYLTNETDTLHFSGPNVYRAVYAWEVMDEQGYEVNLDFEGKWTDTQEPVKGIGVIIKGEEGAFTIIYDNHEVTVGGPTSGKEHISASSLKLVQMHEAVVKIGLEPIETATFSDLADQLTKIAFSAAGGLGLYNYAVDGTVTIDSKGLISPSVVQRIDNILAGSDSSVVFYDNGLRLSLSGTSGAKLKELNEIFGKDIVETKIITSRLMLVARLMEKTERTEQEIINTLPVSAGLYSLTVIEKPIQ